MENIIKLFPFINWKTQKKRSKLFRFNLSNIHTCGRGVTVDRSRVVKRGKVGPTAALGPLDEMSRAEM